VSFQGNKKMSYELDFYSWTQQQAMILKERKMEKVDFDHLIEELESLGNSEERALESHLTNLFMHLLKVSYQPEKHTRSWDNSIKNSSFQSKKILKKSPGLKSKMLEIKNDAYFSAILKASSETGIDADIFPSICPFKLEEYL